MVEKYKLNLLVAFIILLAILWLIRAGLVWDLVGQLLLLGVAVLIVRTLLLREKRQAKLLEFFLKSLIVSYIATAVIWFVWMSITSPGWYYTRPNSDYLINELVINTLPLALLPVAVSVMIYGIFRIRLRAWEMFLSSWYVSVFSVFAVYQVWWSFYVEPNLPEFYYSSIAGAIGLALGLVFLSFIIAGTLTIIYVVLRRQKIEEPKTL